MFVLPADSVLPVDCGTQPATDAEQQLCIARPRLAEHAELSHLR